jgi:drug/metabolite transporter (DMT)-like permease
LDCSGAFYFFSLLFFFIAASRAMLIHIRCVFLLHLLSYPACHPVLGDMLVLLGCLCYAVSNLGQEHLVKCFDRFEFLGMLGLCGSAVSAVQMAALEHEQLAQVHFGSM